MEMKYEYINSNSPENRETLQIVQSTLIVLYIIAYMTLILRIQFSFAQSQYIDWALHFLLQLDTGKTA